MGFDPAIKRTRSAHNGVATTTDIHDPIPGPGPRSSRAVHSVVKCKRHRRRRRRLRAPASCVRACARLGGQKFNYLERPPPPPPRPPPRPSTASALCKKFPSHLPSLSLPSLFPLLSSSLGVPLPRFAPRPEGDIILVTCPLAPTYSTSFDPSLDFSGSIDLARTRPS